MRSIQTGADQVEYTPIGHTTNLASRMQTLANPGSIAIGGALRNLIEGYFALKPLGPARIKSVSEPVNVYEAPSLGGGLNEVPIPQRRLTRARNSGRPLTRTSPQTLYERNDPVFDLRHCLIGWRAIEISHLPEFDSAEILGKPLLQKGQMLI